MIKWKFHQYYCIPNAIIRCKPLILPFPSPLTSDIVQTVPFDCVSGPKLEEERHILLPSGKLHLITTSRTWKGCSPLINFLVARCAFVGAPPTAFQASTQEINCSCRFPCPTTALCRSPGHHTCQHNFRPLCQHRHHPTPRTRTRSSHHGLSHECVGYRVHSSRKGLAPRPVLR